MDANTRRKRSRSPYDDARHTRRYRSSPPRQPAQRYEEVDLPYGAVPLFRHDLESHRPLFALYLDIQKQLDIEDIQKDELKGRWKSFYGKWNRGELSKHWYDPQTFSRAVNASVEPVNSIELSDEEHQFGPKPQMKEEMGHTFPPNHKLQKPGPSIPSYVDLQSRREEAQEEEHMIRRQEKKQLYHNRKLDQQTQRERLDEIQPRAQAGTRDRQLEKKREKADSNRAFAAAREVGGDIEVRETDLMGDGDSLAELKRMQKEQERKKTERELRREELLRARTAEREEKLKGMKQKEEKTMEFLKEIARARFGDNV